MIIGPDATVLCAYMLKRLGGIIKRLKVVEAGVKKNLDLTHGLIYSSLVLVALMKKGLKTDDAYSIVQDNSMKLWAMIEKGDNDANFLDILNLDKRVTEHLAPKDLETIFSAKTVFKNLELMYKRVL